MILDRIIEKVKIRVAEQKSNLPLGILARQNFTSAPGLFKTALQRPGIQVIAEIKKASPSAGIICPGFEPSAIAEAYVDAGVAAISVLTESDFFQGSLEILATVRQKVELPLLRKDFIIDPYQIYQAKYYGANCVLLIASILSLKQLAEFSQLAARLQMNALVEVHDETDIEKALTIDADIIGINNRDLKTFEVSLDTTLQLKRRIPGHIIVVSESGIKNRQQVQQLEEAGIDAILIGETLMRSENKKECVQSLMGRTAI